MIHSLYFITLFHELGLLMENWFVFLVSVLLGRLGRLMVSVLDPGPIGSDSGLAKFVVLCSWPTLAMPLCSHMYK